MSKRNISSRSKVFNNKVKKAKKIKSKLKVIPSKENINKISPKIVDILENSSELKDEVIKQILKDPSARERLAERVKEELF